MYARVVTFLAAFSLVWGLTLTAAAQENWPDSLARLNKAIQQSPRSTDLRLKKAAVNIELNQWEYAAEEYGRVLSIEPDNLAAHYFRAYVFLHLRQPDKAQRDYEDFLLKSPRHFGARLGLATTKKMLGRKTEAMNQLNLLVEHHPDSAAAFAARAGYEEELEQTEPALYDWDEAIRLAPRNESYVASKVALLIRMKRRGEARATVGEALKRGIPKAALQELTEQINK